GPPEASMVYKLVKSEEDLNDIFGIQGHASLNLGSANVNITEGHFKSSQNRNSRKMSLIFYYRFGVDVSLTDDALAGAETVNPDSVNTCGDAYVAQVLGGILVIAEIEAEFDSVEDKITAGGEMNATYGDKIELGGALDYLASKASSIEKVSMYFRQEGGNAMAISSAVSANSMLGCNFKPGTKEEAGGLPSCKKLVEELKNYTGELTKKYTFENPSEDMGKIPLHYSRAVSVAYGNKSSPEMDKALEPLMEEIIRKKNGLIGLSSELSDAISKIPNKTDDVAQALSNLRKEEVDRIVYSMDATLPPYNKCFGLAPTLSGCTASLERVKTQLTDLLTKSKFMKAYIAAKPTLSYTVNNIALLPKFNGEDSGEYYPEETSCYMFKTNLAGDDYRLYCPNSDSNPIVPSISPGTVTLAFKTDSDDNPTNELEDLEINSLSSCTNLGSSQPGEKGRRLCSLINYSGALIANNTKKKTVVWKWMPKNVTITPLPGRKSYPLFDDTHKIKAFTITSNYDGYIDWQKDLLSDTKKDVAK
ncbi:MAG TPA: hypothetical protein VKR58_03320, partial [Aquella sp.]|nr:hypothetical protein [Aquella sp.]